MFSITGGVTWCSLSKGSSPVHLCTVWTPHEEKCDTLSQSSTETRVPKKHVKLDGVTQKSEQRGAAANGGEEEPQLAWMLDICLWLLLRNQLSRAILWTYRASACPPAGKRTLHLSGWRKKAESPSFCCLQVVLRGKGGVHPRKVWACLYTHAHTNTHRCGTQKCAYSRRKRWQKPPSFFGVIRVCSRMFSCLFVCWGVFLCTYLSVYVSRRHQSAG